MLSPSQPKHPLWTQSDVTLYRVVDFSCRTLLTTRILDDLKLESVQVMCGGCDGETPVVHMKCPGQKVAIPYSLHQAAACLIDMIRGRCKTFEYWRDDNMTDGYWGCVITIEVRGTGLKVIRNGARGPTYLSAVLKAYNDCLRDRQLYEGEVLNQLKTNRLSAG